MTNYTDELDRLQTYAHQNGWVAALKLAADDITKLRAALAALHPLADGYAGAIAELQKLRQPPTNPTQSEHVVIDGLVNYETECPVCHHVYTATVVQVKKGGNDK